MPNTPDPRSLMKGVEEIDSLTAALDLPEKVKTRATELYRKSAGNGSITKQYSARVTAAACILLAARETSVAIDASTLASHSTDDSTTENQVLTNSKTIRQELDLEVVTTDPHTIIDQITDDLESPLTIKRAAHSLASEIEDTALVSGRKAKTVAAACVYLAGTLTNHSSRKNYYTQTELQDVANVAENTLRNCYYDFNDHIAENPDRYVDTEQLQRL